jgi:hypothetical protein
VWTLCRADGAAYFFPVSTSSVLPSCPPPWGCGPGRLVQTPAFVVPLGFGYIASVRSLCVLSSIMTITRFGHSATVAIVCADQVDVAPFKTNSWISGWGADVNNL